MKFVHFTIYFLAWIEVNLGQPHKIMCKRYSEELAQSSNGTCELQRSKRIIGGSATELKFLPHMVQVGVAINPPQINWICGGSLISDHFIMSSAGCDPPSYVKWVRLGFVENYTEENKPIVRKVTRTYQHPDFDRLHLYYNVVLLKVKDKIIFTPLIRPICLFSGEALPEHGMISGWGLTDADEESRPSGSLYQAKVSILPTETCKLSFKNATRGLPIGFLDSIQLCAQGDKNQDSCRGDEGGPLQVKMEELPCMYEQVGIINRIPPPNCGSRPGVYTRVSTFVSWIENIVWTDADVFGGPTEPPSKESEEEETEQTDTSHE